MLIFTDKTETDKVTLLYNYHNRICCIKFFWHLGWGMESEDWWKWRDINMLLRVKFNLLHLPI